MNTQEAFDLIWERAQSKVRALDSESNTCRYRINGSARKRGNNACFVGVCIPPGAYSPEIEGISITHFKRDFEILKGRGSSRASRIKRVLDVFEDCDMGFLYECQEVHDIQDPENWNKALTEIAKKWNLKIPKQKK